MDIRTIIERERNHDVHSLWFDLTAEEVRSLLSVGSRIANKMDETAATVPEAESGVFG